MTALEDWSVWYPHAASTGVLVARARIAPARRILFHAPPDVLSVEVVAGNSVVATGKDLARTIDSPMCRLTREGDTIVREDCWPGDADIDEVVVLPGGEAGRLVSWWHATDRQEWRWQVEFFNSLRERVGRPATRLDDGSPA